MNLHGSPKLVQHPPGGAVEHFFCTDPVWLESARATAPPSSWLLGLEGEQGTVHCRPFCFTARCHLHSSRVRLQLWI
jgi:hypothetical protein